MRARPVDLGRLGLGVVAVARPQWLLRVARSEDGRWPRRLIRVLGARYLLQSGGGLAVRDRWVPEADAAVDVVHALSMVGAALVLPAHRRLALASAVLAAGFAAADLAERRP